MKKPDSVWIDVLWLRPHKRYSYFAGQVGIVQRVHLDELLGGEGVPAYVRQISQEEKDSILKERNAPKPVPTEPMISVLWLKYHPRYAYKPNEIGKVYASAAVDLLDQEYCRPISQNEIEERERAKIPVKPQPADFVKVVFKKYHPGFAYSPGDRGIVAKAKIEDLLKGDYVKLDYDVAEIVESQNKEKKI